MRRWSHVFSFHYLSISFNRIIEREFCVYLTFSFSLFTSFNRQDSDVCFRFLTKTIFATPTKQFLLAEKSFHQKNSKNWAAWNYRVYLTFSESDPHNSAAFLLADEEFSSKTHITQNVSFAFISRFHFHYSHHSTDRKWCLFAIQRYLRKTNETIFASHHEEFFQKTHITRASKDHAFIFNSHLSDACLRFER